MSCDDGRVSAEGEPGPPQSVVLTKQHRGMVLLRWQQHLRQKPRGVVQQHRESEQPEPPRTVPLSQQHQHRLKPLRAPPRQAQRHQFQPQLPLQALPMRYHMVASLPRR